MASEKTYSLSNANIELTDFALPMGLTLSKVLVQSSSASLELPGFSFSSEEPLDVIIEINSGDLQKFLVIKAPSNISDVWVNVQEGVIWVQATVKVLISVNARAGCDLKIVDKKKLEVELKSVDVAGVGAKSIVQSQIDQVNPIFDLSELPVDGEITRVQILEGLVRVFAKVRPKKA